MATVQEQFKARDTQSQANINSTYDASLNSQKQALSDAFAQNAAAQAEQKQKAKQDYGVAAYDVGVQNDRNDRNLTQFADVRGMNYNGGSQHALNLGMAKSASTGKIAYGQQQAIQESDRQSALRTLEYQNQVAAALADNNYKRAAALMDDYNNQQKWQEQQAQILASYGNFDPYKALYGDATANSMQSMWNAQNPETAYRLGRIDAETYKNITGKWPRGYNPPSSGGGYYGGGGQIQLKKAGDIYLNTMIRPWDGTTTSGDLGWGNTEKKLGMTDTSHAVRSGGKVQTAGQAGWNDTSRMLKSMKK